MSRRRSTTPATCCKALFFDPKRYDLTKVGRYKLNQRLGVDVPDDTRVLTTEDILALVRQLIALPTNLGVPEDSKDYAADAAQLNRDADPRRARRVRALRQPAAAHDRAS